MDKYIIITILVIIVLLIMSTINSIIRLKNRIKRSQTGVDIHLKKRFDLIPNLVEVVKGYAKYEQSTLEEIARLRSIFQNNPDTETGNKLNEHYKQMIAVIERYPDLKASENFLQLQKTLTKVESEISAARRIYVNDITRYNTKIQSFPTNVLASIMGYKPYELPRYESEEVNIKF